MAVHEITVYPREPGQDVAGETIARQAAGLGVAASVSTAQVYLLEFGASVHDPEAALATLRDRLLTDPNTQIADTTPRTLWDDPNEFRVGYLPGAQDPQQEPIKRAAARLGVPLVEVVRATEYTFSNTSPKARDTVTANLLVNPSIHTVHTRTPDTLRVPEAAGPVERIPVKNMTLAELKALSETREWHATETTLRVIKERYQNDLEDPTDAALEFIVARRSDHCAHTTFGADVIEVGKDGVQPPPYTRLKATAREVIKETGERVVSAFKDNAGVVKFFGGYGLTFKEESHNGPSAIAPKEGAATGTGGLVRDILATGRGSKPVLLTCTFGLAPPDLAPAEIPPGCKRPDFIRRSVIAGTSEYGNQLGIPTGDVRVVYDPDYRAKPVVLAGGVGVIPLEKAQKGVPRPGDLVITIGGRTGRDGIHGATFSSGSMTAETAVRNATAVQNGDPIMEKKVRDALLELRDAGLIRAVTDCGAAGYGSAVGEMGEACGVSVQLENVPVKYNGLSPYELLLSESQERMVLAVEDDPEKLALLYKILGKHDVEGVQIGVFTDDNHFTATYDGEVLVRESYDFLNNGFPRETRLADWQPPALPESASVVTDWAETYKRLLAHPNIASTERILRQYDHTVHGGTVVHPFGGVRGDMPNDASVTMPLINEVPDKSYGLVHAHAVNPSIMQRDPYHGAIGTVAEAIARYVAVGGDPTNSGEAGMALMNNYVCPTHDAQTFGALTRTVDGVNAAQKGFKAPVASGKDSTNGHFKGGGFNINTPLTLDITVVGGMEDANKAVTADLKALGSTLVLVGAPDYGAMGGSVLNEVTGGESTRVSQVDMEVTRRSFEAVYRATDSGAVLAATAISRGGLMVAVARMSFGGTVGVQLDFDSDVPLEQRLGNETGGGLVVEVADEAEAARLFAGVPHQVIGRTTTEHTITVLEDKRHVFSVPVEDLRAAWKQPMEDF